MVPRAYFSDTTPGVLRLLNEDEWRSIGISQSPGWVHYEVHGMFATRLRRALADPL
jgi:cyclin-dependent kinase regulatory subunit CKS1